MTDNISDEDLLEYLMTSDLNENHKPSEYKFLIMKFRAFYKILRGRYKLETGDLKFSLNNRDEIIASKDKEVLLAKTEKAEVVNKLNSNGKKRKLTWKERWNGEIERF